MKSNSHILGVFDDPDTISSAVDELLKNNIVVKDVFSPFPLEHVWKKLKLKTRIPLATFLYGAFGTASVYAFLYWSSVVNYPLIFGGKPANSLSFVIIMFVIAILSGVIFTLLTFLIREKLWPGKHVELPDPRTTDDKFVIVIEESQQMDEVSVQKIDDLLKSSGAVEVKISNN